MPENEEIEVFDLGYETCEILKKLKEKLDDLDPESKEYEAVLNNYIRVKDSIDKRDDAYHKQFVEEQRLEADKSDKKKERTLRLIEIGIDSGLSLAVLGFNMKLGNLSLRDAWQRISKAKIRRH